MTLFFFFFLKTSFSFQLWRDGNLPDPDTPRETTAVERYRLFLEAAQGAAGELNPVLGREWDPGRGEESFAQVHGGGFQRHLEGLLGDFQGDRKPLAAGRGGTAGTPTHPPTHPGIRMPRHLNETLEATT